ncbi:class I SAM-dependent methyltransferase [Thiohalorhabdus sp. Cl-TMA]|uniref:Class I SAM-dependent methyltransferase n=1 Tax=Thiohalorhabdus methylotrophus TaxID=3242694 RepID=A0ABV4TYR9_9GAMM
MSVRNLQMDPQSGEHTLRSADYRDRLVDWESRAASGGDFLERLLHRQDVRSVADVACGTGVTALGLARSGLTVTAADGSPHMVAKTREAADEQGVALADARVADWMRLDRDLGANRFDAVVCLGDAFSHLFESEARRDAVEAFYRTVRPGGLLILDHRNYDALLESGTGSRPYQSGQDVEAWPTALNRYLTRFEYRFRDGARFQRSMYPLRQDYVSHLLEDAGFVDVERFGDFQRPYNRLAARLIQQVGRKPRG